MPSHLGRTFVAAVAVVSLQQSTALAARPCAASSSPYKWTIREWTYDGPDKTATGPAAIYSTIGLFLTTGRTYWSCESSWPETQQGWKADGSALLWSECLDTGAGGSRGADDTVLFAMDWKTKTMHLSHTFSCSDQAGATMTAVGSSVLDLQCDAAEKPTRCTTKVAEINVDTFQTAP